jgi:hypothetical protein
MQTKSFVAILLCVVLVFVGVYGSYVAGRSSVVSEKFYAEGYASGFANGLKIGNQSSTNSDVSYSMGYKLGFQAGLKAGNGTG